MTFTGIPFVILLLVTYPLWLLCKGRERYQARVLVLLIASLVFYGHDDWRLLFVLCAYGVVDWAAGCWIARARHRRVPLALGVAFNLTVLAYWKYAPMLLRTLHPVLGIADPTVVEGGWIIPFGVSFYSFTGIAYLVDVYRATIPAETNLLRCMLHLAFFPHLMAGPILRARQFLTQLQPDRMPDRPQAPREAALLLARGFFKKLVLADRIGAAIDPFFLHVGEPATSGVWGMPFLYLYAFQIYFDFSGYTDIARGLALFFGFRWPDNFNLPYLAASPREFWQRWHITLSQFLRDYLYIPLGGSRVAAWRTHVNVMITMLLGGLWHGGSWSFLLWGGLHGALVVAQRMWAASRWRTHLRQQSAAWTWAARPVAIALTFNVVCLMWSFFRLTDWRQSLACLRSCFWFDADKLLSSASGDLSLWSLLRNNRRWLVRRPSIRSPKEGLLLGVNGEGAGLKWADTHPRSRRVAALLWRRIEASVGCGRAAPFLGDRGRPQRLPTLLGVYGALALAARQCKPILKDWDLGTRRANFVNGFTWGVALAVLALAVLLAPNEAPPPFIYFQF